MSFAAPSTFCETLSFGFCSLLATCAQVRPFSTAGVNRGPVMIDLFPKSMNGYPWQPCGLVSYLVHSACCAVVSGWSGLLFTAWCSTGVKVRYRLVYCCEWKVSVGVFG